MLTQPDSRPVVPSGTSQPVGHTLKRHRVLFVETNADGTVGGSHRVLLEIVQHLDRGRFEPLVAFAEENILVPQFRKIASVLVLPTGRFVLAERVPTLGQLALRRPWLFAPALAAQKVYNLVRHAIPGLSRTIALLLRERIDLVCLNNAPVHATWLLAARVTGVPCVSYFRGTPHIVSPWHARLFPRFDRILSISRAVTDNALRNRVQVDNFTLIYDGIDAGAVRSAAAAMAPAIGPLLGRHAGPVIGVVNNLKDWKGQHVAVEAMHLLKDRRPEAVCLLVGGTDEVEYVERIRQMIGQYGLENRVVLTGFRTDSLRFLAELDLVLHTSLSSEGFPRVILEAMALGRPLIVSDAGPNVEMVEDGISGLVVPAGNADALAARIEEALDNEVLCRSLGTSARERVDSLFNIDLNMRKTEAVFDEVLEA